MRKHIGDSYSKLPSELLHAIHNIYQPAGMGVTDIYPEEGSEYGACRFTVEGHQVVFRVAKTTPKMAGQFVTVWHRPHENAPYVPFNIDDPVEFIVVNVTDAETKNSGQFVFDREVLVRQGIMGNGKNRGKGAFRVYPPWTEPKNKTAVKTQRWQIEHFFYRKPLDLTAICKLFKCC